MQITWLVQNGGFSTTNLTITQDTLDRMALPYKNFSLNRQTNQVSNLEHILQEPSEQFIIRGGTSLLSVLNRVESISEMNPNLLPQQIIHSRQFIHHLKAGIFYDEQGFDQAYYGKMDLPLLNRDVQYLSVRENLEKSFNVPMFIKPSRDQKAFGAGILDTGNTIKDFIFSQVHENFYIDEMAVIAPVKKIFAEYRFFIVDRQVITGCQYRNHHSLFVSEHIPASILEAAKEYAQLYQPHEIFTMDLADTPEGVSIIEYNCWNASSLYKTNVAKIFDAVNEHRRAKLGQLKKSKPSGG